MAERIIRGANDDALYKVSKTVTEINAGILRLLDDLIETMRVHQGLGLAAPQVGIAKRIFVVEYEEQLYEMINPELILEEGELIDIEGCLSYPGIWAEVVRPERVVMRALNRRGESFELEARGVLARALRHEFDHLLGQVFVDKVLRFFDEDELEEEYGAVPSIRAVIEYRAGER